MSIICCFPWAKEHSSPNLHLPYSSKFLHISVRNLWTYGVDGVKLCFLEVSGSTNFSMMLFVMEHFLSDFLKSGFLIKFFYLVFSSLIWEWLQLLWLKSLGRAGCFSWWWWSQHARYICLDCLSISESRSEPSESLSETSPSFCPLILEELWVEPWVRVS